MEVRGGTRRGVQRYAEGCTEVHRGTQRYTEGCAEVRGGMWRGMQRGYVEGVCGGVSLQLIRLCGEMSLQLLGGLSLHLNHLIA